MPPASEHDAATTEQLKQLHFAILNANLAAVKDMVQRGVPLNASFAKDYMPPLHTAIKDKKSAIVKFLLQAGADVNLQVTDRQQSPLMLAADEGRFDFVQALLAAGADVHAGDAIGWTALDAAAYRDSNSAGGIVETLVAAGAEVNRHSKTWGTPLIKACWRGHPSAVRALVARGADVNAMTANGTPLVLAIDNKRAEHVSILLAAGADPTLPYDWPEKHGGNREYLGMTPLELARVRKAKNILELLENPTATPTATPVPEPTAADVPALWKRLKKALAKAAPECKKSLAKPATEKGLAEVATLVGLSLPDDFAASYRVHDGQKADADGLYLTDDSLDEAYQLMPLKQLVIEWTMLKGLYDGGEFQGQEGTPDDGIRGEWWHPAWVPFATDGGGDFLCVDLAPTAKGAVGQVIQFCHDSAGRPLVARSFAAFLGLLIEKWEQQVEESG